jgi:cytochrome bd-type quinol oxidase subunit 2
MDRNQVASYDLLSNGGVYLILVVFWVLSAASFYFVGTKLGQKNDSHNDGCLLGFSCVFLAFLGGALGIFLAKYPYFVISSCLGSISCPALACFYIKLRMNKN